MGTFTMELREVLKLTNDIGLNDYPIFDENYRVPLNQKIIDHYLLREIGAETIDMFRLYMRRKMNEIMPEFNQFYLSERIKIDPMQTLSIKSFMDQTNSASNTSEGTSTSESVSDSKARSVNSTTPQQMLSDFGDYADGASDSIGKTDNTGTGVENSTTTADANTTATNESTGYSGNQSDMLNRYRSTFLNIDLEIINRLDREGLFMNIWASGDSYFEREGFRYGNAYGYYPLYTRF